MFRYVSCLSSQGFYDSTVSASSVWPGHGEAGRGRLSRKGLPGVLPEASGWRRPRTSLCNPLSPPDHAMADNDREANRFSARAARYARVGTNAS